MWDGGTAPSHNLPLACAHPRVSWLHRQGRLSSLPPASRCAAAPSLSQLEDWGFLPTGVRNFCLHTSGLSSYPFVLTITLA